MSTIQYSDPLFEELLSRVPKDQMRTSSLSFGIASRIIEIMERRGWLQPPNGYRVSMHRVANDFAECVKRMSGKSPCGEANTGHWQWFGD